MSVRVKNLNKTGDKDPYPHVSWLKYWEAKSGEKAGECSACTNKAAHGGHIRKVEGIDENNYITPLCDYCIKRVDEFNVYAKLVPATE